MPRRFFNKRTIAFWLFLVFSAIQSCDYQPYKQGKILYTNFCASCHIEDGTGLRGVYPPLAQSNYLANNQSLLPCIIRHGLSDSIQVNGQWFNQPMAAIPNLNEVEITNIINYVNHAWGNDLPHRKVEEVRHQLENCKPSDIK